MATAVDSAQQEDAHHGRKSHLRVLRVLQSLLVGVPAHGLGHDSLFSGSRWGTPELSRNVNVMRQEMVLG